MNSSVFQENVWSDKKINSELAKKPASCWFMFLKKCIKEATLSFCYLIDEIFYFTTLFYDDAIKRYCF